MSRVFLTMAMSLDGFITGPDDGPENPAGTGGMRLMDWLSPGEEGDPSGGGQWRPADPEGRQVFDEAMGTGAVITGKRTGDFASHWGGDHHGGVPIFVPTHEPPAEHIELELTRAIEAPGTMHLRYDVKYEKDEKDGDR